MGFGGFVPVVPVVPVEKARSGKKRRKPARVRRGARMNFAPLKRHNGFLWKPNERKAAFLVAQRLHSCE
ncbi:MAG: hypothetical protein M5R42_15780 [Rhodocyclaceae bacterium]|nr:hypothetical protein [Rhodocyclaceae bacterium]